MRDEDAHKKLDKLSDQISEINVTLARNTLSLEEHMKQTKLLREYVDTINSNGTVAYMAMLNRAKGIAWFVGLLMSSVVLVKGLIK